MAAFDESKFNTLVVLGTVQVEGGGNPIILAIKSYDGGVPKLYLTRRGEGKGGKEYFSALGGVTSEELVAVLEVLGGEPSKATLAAFIPKAPKRKK